MAKVSALCGKMINYALRFMALSPSDIFKSASENRYLSFLHLSAALNSDIHHIFVFFFLFYIYFIIHQRKFLLCVNLLNILTTRLILIQVKMQCDWTCFLLTVSSMFYGSLSKNSDCSSYIFDSVWWTYLNSMTTLSQYFIHSLQQTLHPSSYY